MQLDRLRAAGIPLDALSTPVRMYRGSSSNVKLHSHHHCEHTKADLYSDDVVVTEHPDSKFCCWCARPAEVHKAYYAAAQALIQAADRLGALTFNLSQAADKGHTTTTLVHVNTATSIELSIRQACADGASDALDAWAAPLLERAQHVLADVTARCSHASDPDLAVRLVAIGTAEQEHRDAARRSGTPTRATSGGGRPAPITKKAYPALCASEYGFRQDGQGGIVPIVWKAWRGRYLTSGSMSQATAAATLAGEAVLKAATGPENLAQVPTDTALPTTAGMSLGQAITAAWKDAAAAELVALCAELEQAVTAARAQVEDGEQVLGCIAGWKETHRATGDSTTTVLGRWSPVALPGTTAAMLKAPAAVLDWLSERKPFFGTNSGVDLREVAPAQAGDDDSLLLITLTLHQAHPARGTALRTALEQLLPQARAAAYQPI